MHKAQIGTVSEATLRPQDLIQAFLWELDWLGEDISQWEREIPEDEDSEWWDTEEPNWILDELFDALNEHAPELCYFGAHVGDWADFGFWPIDDIFDGEDIVARGPELPDKPTDEMQDTENPDLFMTVSDHGNYELYSWNGTEWVSEWGIV